jgi:YebC/PmpR family DNA-binding regulatory protein
MSGHSKWSTIKHQKAAKDAARGKLFSRLSKAISVAVKTGGGGDPQKNSRLRVAIETAKAANVPKDNITRAIARAEKSSEVLEEVTYEGFGPGGIQVIAEVATDNRNRTGQEIKNIFEKAGGRLGGPGSVSFNFQKKGSIVVKKESDVDNQMLKLIDLGADDVEETDEGIELYMESDKLAQTKNRIEKADFRITSLELTQNPKSNQTIEDQKLALKALSFLEKLQDHEDVQKVSANLDVPKEVVKKLSE